MSARAVACPKDYDYVYRQFRSFLRGVVYNAGVPACAIDDASGEIFARMMAKDGLAAYRGSITEDNPRGVKAYLARYYALAARAELSRVRNHTQRVVSIDTLTESLTDTLPAESGEELPDSELLDQLMELTTGDARHFIEVASQNPTYSATRAALLAEGWETIRVRRAVREARAAVRTHLASR